MKESLSQPNGPEIRIVGRIPEKTKEGVRQYMQELFGERHLDSLSEDYLKEVVASELLKTEEDIFFIDFANKISNEIMERAGAKPYQVPPENFHLLPYGVYKKIDDTPGGRAITESHHQAIFLNDGRLRDDPFILGQVVFHELMHFKSHFAMEAKIVKGEGELKIRDTMYRHGLAIGSAQQKIVGRSSHEHFRGFNEALIASQEKLFFDSLFRLSQYKKERKHLGTKEGRKLKKIAAERMAVPEDEVLWVSQDGKNFRISAYPKHLEVFLFVAQEIQKRFPGRYKSEGEVTQEFLKSLFSGKLSTITRLVEKTFDRGSFEVLGMMSNDRNSAIQMLEYLKRARHRARHKRL